MTRRPNGPLVVCATAGLFTLGTLLVNPQPRPVAAPAPSPPAPAPLVPPAGRPSVTLAIENFRFGPVSAAPGAAVVVVNADGDEHTVSASDGSFSVRVAAGGKTSFAAPTAPGAYTFVCDIHPSMRGRLVVA